MLDLYALQYGVYDSSLEAYLSIPKFLTNLINEMYLIERAFVGNSYDLSSLPMTEQFINSIGYNDLCAMQQNGDFLNSPYFNTTINSSSCLAINNQILTKGFYSSLINLL